VARRRNAGDAEQGQRLRVQRRSWAHNPSPRKRGNTPRSNATEILYRGPAGGGNPHLMRAPADPVDVGYDLVDVVLMPASRRGSWRTSGRDRPHRRPHGFQYAS